MEQERLSELIAAVPSAGKVAEIIGQHDPGNPLRVLAELLLELAASQNGIPPPMPVEVPDASVAQ